ncbi:MAG: ABC transporter permease, partial [Bdellovibrionaceae bacterium]|nr:ABC transporter permease [Pseudobdellovibrionaceae bacterium]
SSEPLTAIIPGVALADLWRTLGYFEVTLRIISWLVTAVAMIGLSVVLVISLHQRRREMAILRAIGAGLRHIAALLVIESVFFTFGGILVGFLLSELGFLVVTNWLGADLGITMENKMPGLEDTLMVTAVLIAGFVAGLLAAWRARNLALKDGLRPGV